MFNVLRTCCDEVPDKVAAIYYYAVLRIIHEIKKKIQVKILYEVWELWLQKSKKMSATFVELFANVKF